jgi:hypothetical protein
MIYPVGRIGVVLYQISINSNIDFFIGVNSGCHGRGDNKMEILYENMYRKILLMCYKTYVSYTKQYVK